MICESSSHAGTFKFPLGTDGKIFNESMGLASVSAADVVEMMVGRMKEFLVVLGELVAEADVAEEVASCGIFVSAVDISIDLVCCSREMAGPLVAFGKFEEHEDKLLAACDNCQLDELHAAVTWVEFDETGLVVQMALFVTAVSEAVLVYTSK